MEREQQIFKDACDITEPAKRVAYLDKACHGEPVMREHIDRLLMHHQQTNKYLDEPVVQLPGLPVSKDPDDLINPNLTWTHVIQQDQGQVLIGKQQLPLQLEKSTRPGSFGRLRDYDLMEVVAEGGFGVVCKGTHFNLEQPVAIKFLQDASQSLAEARLTASVVHPNVVRVTHVSSNDELNTYLVMEYVSGGTLKQFLENVNNKEESPPDLIQMLRIGKQIADGLEAAHKMGFVHRDIKPANILLDRDSEQVKISDFGLAREVGNPSLRASHKLLTGTPPYMSPEQVNGKNVDRRSDLFSLGSVLYELFTRKTAFGKGDIYAVLDRVQRTHPTPIRELNPEIPQDLADLVTRLHKKTPEDRIQTAGEVSDLLERRLNPPPPRLLTGSVDAPSIRPTHLWLTAVAAAAVAAIVCSIIAGVWLWTPRWEATTVQTGLSNSFGSRSESTSPTSNPSVPIATSSTGVTRAVGVQPPISVSWGSKFPVNPEPGAIHSVTVGEPATKFTFCWVPAKGVIDGFWLLRTEMTQGQWNALKIHDDGAEANSLGEKDPYNPSFIVGDEMPVTNVTWPLAVSACKKLGELSGLEVRLPTQREWEHAARAGTTTEYHSGDGEEALNKAGWYKGNADYPKSVGLKEPNAWSLYDMHGNMWEWCSDKFTAGGFPAVRGGSWSYPAYASTSSYPSGFPANTRSGISLRPAVIVLTQGTTRRPPSEHEAITACLDVIRRCQLKDGAIRVKADGDAVWVCPYFANLAAMGMLAAHERSNPNPADLQAVGRWLEWYATHQNPDGTINDQEGFLLGGYKDNGKRDSEDSYASTYIMTVARYQRLNGSTSSTVQVAARRAFKAIEAVVDPHDGLTWAKRDYKVKYLMDNLETYGGLTAAKEYFHAIGDDKESKHASALADATAASIPKFWDGSQRLYAWAIHPDGKRDIGFLKPYPDGLANLMGLSWGPTADAVTWSKVKTTFAPAGKPALETTPEHWYMASLRNGTTTEQSTWQSATLEAAADFMTSSEYAHRAGVTVLALLDGRSWMSSATEK